MAAAAAGLARRAAGEGEGATAYYIAWGGLTYHFVAQGEELRCAQVGAVHTPLQFELEEQAAAFVRRLMTDEAVRGWLRQLASGGAIGSQRLNDDEVVRALTYLLTTRRLEVLHCRPPLEPTLPQEAEGARAPAEREKAAPVVEKHWIEFKVVEEKTKRFVSEVTLKVELPGRGEETHSTEARALHIPLGQAGVAKIVGMEHAESWIVVAVQQG
ncbi:MAG: hypothetical protein ACP5U2_02660 [Bryobacteraceae bacterium]